MRTIREALEFLAELDRNYATAQNGQGFSKFTSPIGHALVQSPWWTPSQFEMAKKIVTIHRRQLPVPITELDDSPEANNVLVEKPIEEIVGNDEPNTPVKVQWHPKDRAIKVSFPYNQKLVKLIKEIRWDWRAFDWDTKEWTIIVPWKDEEELKLLREFGKEAGVLTKIEKVFREFEETPAVRVENHQLVIPNAIRPKLSKRIDIEIEQLTKWLPKLWGADREIVEKLLSELLDEILESQAEETTEEIITPTGIKLFPYQSAGVKTIEKRLSKHGIVLVADPMGLGKTIQAIMTVERNPHLKPTLVICPASVKYNWKREIEKFAGTPADKIAVLEGKNPDPQKLIGKEWVIINYDILQHWAETLAGRGFQTIIFDEVHYIKNPKAKRTQSAKLLIDKIPNKILLSGTPIHNQPKDFLNLLDIFNAYNALGISQKEFKNRFVDWEAINIGRKTIWEAKSFKNTETLNNLLRAKLMLRREKEEVLKELPPKIRHELWIKLDTKDFNKYKKVSLYLAPEDEKFNRIYKLLKKKGVEIPARIKTIPQFMEWLFNERPSAFIELYGKEWLELGKLKTKYALQWIKDFLETHPDEKLVVFAYHKEVQDKLFKEIQKLGEKHGFDVVNLFAGVKGQKRQEIIDRFQEDPRTKVIVISLMAGKEGITLTASKNSLFTEIWYNPNDLLQAEDRIHRIGQTDVANIHYLLAENTIDEMIWNLVNKKIQIMKSVLQKASIPNI